MPRGGSKKGERRGGRQPGTPNKATAELRGYAGGYSKEAIEGLVMIARNSPSDQARVAAWREVLDRAAGKPAQAITDVDGSPVSIPASISFVIRQQPGAENRS